MTTEEATEKYVKGDITFDQWLEAVNMVPVPDGELSLTPVEQRAYYKGVARGHEDYDFSKVTRVEVIDSNGRAYVAYDVTPTIMLQDDGLTLKVFVDRRDD